MRGMFMAVLAASLAFGGPEAAPAPVDTSANSPTDRPGVTLVARFESSASRLDSSQQRAIAHEVERIWSPHVRVAIAWPESLDSPGFDERLDLVITDRLPPSGSPDALGWVDFFAPDQPGRTLTVSINAAHRLAAQAKWPVSSWPVPRAMHDRFIARTLARSVSHELGHVLLRSSAHTTRGLMRARFVAADMFDSAAGFRLAPTERAAVAARLRQLAQRSPG